ncbi:hypothetical protein B0T24DRAFT_629648 [Lasiosphaeria ovina]|uniref:Uncharacterized protein n=1 Tax=Lasiosphaeria ovina TaxID=92902 RepID=A0AAE0N5J7_9PEZI|nr:hypothetical protein B0T24DRAFT_629648 [Lasiosphaeria ovina]
MYIHGLPSGIRRMEGPEKRPVTTQGSCVVQRSGSFHVVTPIPSVILSRVLPSLSEEGWNGMAVASAAIILHVLAAETRSGAGSVGHSSHHASRVLSRAPKCVSRNGGALFFSSSIRSVGLISHLATPLTCSPNTRVRNKNNSKINNRQNQGGKAARREGCVGTSVQGNHTDLVVPCPCSWLSRLSSLPKGAKPSRPALN